MNLQDRLMPLTLLVVEDDPAISLTLTAYFEDEGYGMVAAATAEDALGLIHDYHPHLIIADIGLPQMDGYELVRKIRMLPAYRLLPVIFLTARGQVEDRVRGYRLGCDAYVAKPFDLSELSAIVRNLLDRHQMAQTEWRVRTHGAKLSQDDPDLERSSQARDLSLPEREVQVLSLLCQGLSNRQIGLSLSLSPRTVEKYVSRLLQRTETTNRADLVRYAMEHQLVALRSSIVENLREGSWRSDDSE
jgi:DNA-binding NarL/FixJ family response regulator